MPAAAASTHNSVASQDSKIIQLAGVGIECDRSPCSTATECIQIFNTLMKNTLAILSGCQSWELMVRPVAACPAAVALHALLIYALGI